MWTHPSTKQGSISQTLKARLQQCAVCVQRSQEVQQRIPTCTCTTQLNVGVSHSSAYI